MDGPTSQSRGVLLLYIFYAEVWSFYFNCNFMCAEIRQVALRVWCAGAVWLNSEQVSRWWQRIFYDDVFSQASILLHLLPSIRFISFVLVNFMAAALDRMSNFNSYKNFSQLHHDAPYVYNQKSATRSVFGHQIYSIGKNKLHFDLHINYVWSMGYGDWPMDGKWGPKLSLFVWLKPFSRSVGWASYRDTSLTDVKLMKLYIITLYIGCATCDSVESEKKHYFIFHHHPKRRFPILILYYKI